MIWLIAFIATANFVLGYGVAVALGWARWPAAKGGTAAKASAPGVAASQPAARAHDK
jgi:hypothetical protein